MRPFYAFVTSHCLATYVLVAAVYLLEERGRGPARSVDGGDVVVLVLMPLLSWYMLLEAAVRFEYAPLHTALVFGSYLPVFFLTYFLVRRRRPRHVRPACMPHLRLRPPRDARPLPGVW